MDDLLVIRDDRLETFGVLLLLDQTGELCCLLVVEDFALFDLEHQVGLFVNALIFAVSHNNLLIIFYHEIYNEGLSGGGKENSCWVAGRSLESAVGSPAGIDCSIGTD